MPDFHNKWDDNNASKKNVTFEAIGLSPTIIRCIVASQFSQHNNAYGIQNARLNMRWNRYLVINLRKYINIYLFNFLTF